MEHVARHRAGAGEAKEHFAHGEAPMVGVFVKQKKCADVDGLYY